MYGCCSEEAIIQNLKDAGCSQAMIERFMANLDEEHKSESLKILAAHRRELLELLHKDQKCIDCLDYLVHQLKKMDIEKELKS